MTDNAHLIRQDRIEQMIRLIRGEKVILDSDVAVLYGVETGALNRAVRRNIDRFPGDFMFQLSKEEFDYLKCQFGMSSQWGGRRRSTPVAFTEQGGAMLSSVLRSERAARVNIEIVRTFVRLRQMLLTHTELTNKLATLENKYDEQFRVVFDAIRALMTPAEPEKKEVGFHVKEKKAKYGSKSKKRG